MATLMKEERQLLHVQSDAITRLRDSITEPIQDQSTSPSLNTLQKLQEQYLHLNKDNLAVWKDYILSGQNAIAAEEEITVGPYRQWSPSAVACFVRNADCTGCYYQNFFSDSPHGCQMNDAVKHLLKKLGPPNKRHISKLS